MKNIIIFISLCVSFSSQAFEIKNSCSLDEQTNSFLSIVKNYTAIAVKPRKCEYLHNVRESMYKELGTAMPKIVSTRKINIAVIDTGLDFSIPAFKNKIYVPEGLAKNGFYGFDLNEGDFQPQDTHGHGTHVAGIIVSLFPNARILPIKYGEKTDSYAKAIELAIEAKVDIINISGGGDGFDPIEHNMIKLARKKNILVVASSGNNGKDLKQLKNRYYPASYQVDNIISVMAHDKNGKIASYSNYGKGFSHISALGTLKSFRPNTENCLAVDSGTSFATPVVTATLAMIMAENPTWNIQQVKKQLLSNVEVVEDFSHLNDSNGKVNLIRSVASQK